MVMFQRAVPWEAVLSSSWSDELLLSCRSGQNPVDELLVAAATRQMQWIVIDLTRKSACESELGVKSDILVMVPGSLSIYITPFERIFA